MRQTRYLPPRWFQFRLRTLLIVMTLFAIPFAWIGSEMAQRRREKAVIAWVEKMEGSVGFAEDGWLDKWMGGTVKLTGLADTQAIDLSPLAGLHNLEVLYIENTPVSNLSPLAGLKNLEQLILDNTQVSDLSPLAGLKNLEWLNFVRTKISDLSPLAELKNLKLLFLADTQVSDLSPLAGLNNLEQLALGYTPVSDLSPLTGLKKLEDLGLSSTLVTEEQLQALQKALPNCEITYLNR